MKKTFYLIIIGLFITLSLSNTSTSEFVSSETEEINVAICNSDNGTGWGTYQGFVDSLDGYSWKVGNNDPYSFEIDMINIIELLMGSFMDDDVFIHAGVLNQDFICGSPYNITGRNIEDKIKEYIANGGSFLGTCGGALFSLHQYDRPNTYLEWICNNSGYVNRSWVTYKVNNGFPIFSEYTYMRYFKQFDRYKRTRCNIFGLRPLVEDPDPTRVGSYQLVMNPGMSNESVGYEVSGATNRLKISKSDYPPYNDYLLDYFDVHWCGGPSFNVPSGSNNVEILSCYTEGGLDENDATDLRAWTFQPPGLLNLLVEALYSFQSDNQENQDFTNNLINQFFKLRDWNQTDDKIFTKNSGGDPGHIMFNYPDESGGKVILWGDHPEWEYWEKDGSYVKNVDESPTYNNTIWEGLVRWYDDNDTPGYEDDDTIIMPSDMKYDAKWLTRREVAYASNKVDDKHLPPVYGRSQVVDFDPPVTEDDEFSIDCCVGGYEEDWEKDINLTLYYRYNGSGSSWQWTNWNDSGMYINDNDGPFTFTFNPSSYNGSGRYEFYSILNATDQEGYSLETPPPDGDGDGEPDADSWVLVGGPIIADFNFTNGAPLVNETVTFYDQSYTIYEIQYSEWTF